jgi:hypothetical protein
MRDHPSAETKKEKVLDFLSTVIQWITLLCLASEYVKTIELKS